MHPGVPYADHAAQTARGRREAERRNGALTDERPVEPGKEGQTLMKQMVVVLSRLLIPAVLGLAACGQPNGGAQPGTPPNEVDMGAYSFVQTT